MNKILKALSATLLATAIGGGAYVNSQQAELLQKAVTTVEEQATKKIGTQVKIGKVDVRELKFSALQSSALILHDVEVFDKNNQSIAQVDNAEVNFKLLLLTEDPAGAISEINIDGANVNIQKRDDDSWNFNDIELETEGESTFGAKINIQNASLNVQFDGNKVEVEDISAELDCADLNAIDTKVSAKALGSQIEASGTVGIENQNIHARIDTVNLDEVLDFLPENTLPENFEIINGEVKNVGLHIQRNDEILKYFGAADVADCAVKIEDTKIEDISGSATFNNSEVVFYASATANSQQAYCSGTVYLDTDEVFFDVNAKSESFAPSAIIQNLGIEGAAKFNAHISGTVKNPQVEGLISSDYLAYENYQLQNVETKVRYNGDEIFLSDLNATTFGGKITGEGVIKISDLSYSAHIQAENLNTAQLKNFADLDLNLTGFCSGDVAIKGTSTDSSTLVAYGKVSAENVKVQDFSVSALESSFHFADSDLTIDNLKANLSSHGAVGANGKLEIDNGNLDLNFYAAHIDLSMLEQFDENISVGGLADLIGSVQGNLNNPNIDLKISAVDSSKRGGYKGEIFEQPYDSVKLSAKGSLENLNIETFDLERGGKIVWTVKQGTIGLTGEKNINLELQTTDARLEDIIAYAFPELAATGNLSNVVKITGTADKPQVSGEIDFKRGSYQGFLISNIRGKYFFEDNLLRLQDFEILAPLADARLNGTFDTATNKLNFIVEGSNLSLERLQTIFPREYSIEGDLNFEGVLSGTIQEPYFSGVTSADLLKLNGVELTDVRGSAKLNGYDLQLEEVTFKQGEGVFNLTGSTNLQTRFTSLNATLTDADIPALLAISGIESDIVTGKLNATADFSGTLDKPAGHLIGSVSQGYIGGYDLHNVNLDLLLINDNIFVRNLDGLQGNEGIFKVGGYLKINGPINLNLTSDNLNLAIIPACAGLDKDFANGLFSVNATVQGLMSNPTADIDIAAKGDFKGATFDSLIADISFNNWAFDIKNLELKRTIADKTYRLAAEGVLPIQAFTVRSKNQRLSSAEQLNLTVSLDEADLSLLPHLSDYVAWAVGTMGGSLKITGAAQNPVINGKITLADGTVKIKGMKSLIEHINISTLFSGSRFDIENCAMNIGGGTLSADGGFNFANFDLKDYNFNLKADNLSIDSDFFTGPLNADFALTEFKFRQRDPKIPPKTLPKLSGNIDLKNCLFSVPSIPDSDDELPHLLLDINLNLGDKVHFYSSRLYDMYLTGSAHFERSTRHPKTSGIISVKRGGTITYLQTVFDIREGEIHFNQQDSFMPTVHFAAETKLTRTKIYLLAEGPIGKDTIEFKLTSNPEMSQTEIMQLLTFREAYDQGRTNFTAQDALALGLQMSVLSEIEDTIKRNFGLDKFLVSRGSGSAFENNFSDVEGARRDNEFNISLGKYITDKIMLRYTQGINGDQIKRYGLQYDFNDNWGATFEREGNDYIFGLEMRYNF